MEDDMLHSSMTNAKFSLRQNIERSTKSTKESTVRDLKCWIQDLDSRDLNKSSRPKPNRRSDEEIFTCLRPATITHYKRQLRHLSQTLSYFYSKLLSDGHSSSKIQPKKTITHPSRVAAACCSEMNDSITDSSAKSDYR